MEALMQPEPIAPTHDTILVVDNPDNLLPRVQPLLESDGYRVVIPDAPFSTLTCALQERPQVVLLLTTALQTESFLEVVYQLRTTTDTAAVPIVLVTRYAHEPDFVELVHAWGVTQVIASPFEPQTLRAVIAAQLTPRQE
jgi:response regulator RpfG family c-di-GMP phosphodiesterase